MTEAPLLPNQFETNNQVLPPPVPPSRRWQPFLLAFILGMGTMLIGVLITWAVFERSATKITDEFPTNDKTEQLSSNPTATPVAVMPTLPATETCGSRNLNLFFKLPNNQWLCTVREYDGNSAWIELKNQSLTVTVSDLGRGAPCAVGLDTSTPESCERNLYYENRNYSLWLYKSFGKYQEIYGDFDQGPWIAVKWQNMDTQPLSEAETEQLMTLLNTVEKNVVTLDQ